MRWKKTATSGGFIIDGKVHDGEVTEDDLKEMIKG